MLIRPHSITRSPRRLSGILLLLTGVASALGPSGAGAQTTHGLLDVEVARVDGDPALGLLQAISPSEITLIRDDGSNAVVPRNDALELRPRQPEAVADEPAQLVLMANGDRLVGAVESMDEESVRLNWSGTRSPAELIVPLELIRGILLHQPSQREDRERLTRQWSLHTGAQDRLCLRTGAILEGELLGLFDGRFRLQTSLGPIESARDEVAAFAANPELLSNVPPPASYVLAETTDGSWISFSTLELADGQVLRGETGWGASIEMALTQVLRLCFFGPRVSATSRPDTGQLRVSTVFDGDASAGHQPQRARGMVADRGGQLPPGTGAHQPQRGHVRSRWRVRGVAGRCGRRRHGRPAGQCDLPH